ncbi:MAG TPA: hypothetical protein VLC47_15045 [Burkholderiales bacterium]|nr:hypothetical protein [Burkholderiales bacterium]
MLLRDLRDTGTIAAVFTQPSTRRTIQLKGTDAASGPLEPGDTALIEANIAALVRDMAPPAAASASATASAACFTFMPFTPRRCNTDGNGA